MLYLQKGAALAVRERKKLTFKDAAFKVRNFGFLPIL